MGEPRHHQVTHLGAVEPRVEHVDADEDLRERLFLEALDLGLTVHRVVRAEARDDEIGVPGRGARLFVREHIDRTCAPASRHDVLVTAKTIVLPQSGARRMPFGPCNRFQNIAKFAHHGAVALGDREFSLERGGIDNEWVLLGEQRFQLGPRRVVERVPVDFGASDREPSVAAVLRSWRDRSRRGPGAHPDRLRMV